MKKGGERRPKTPNVKEDPKHQIQREGENKTLEIEGRKT